MLRIFDLFGDFFKESFYFFKTLPRILPIPSVIFLMTYGHHPSKPMEKAKHKIKSLADKKSMMMI